MTTIGVIFAIGLYGLALYYLRGFAHHIIPNVIVHKIGDVIFALAYLAGSFLIYDAFF